MAVDLDWQGIGAAIGGILIGGGALAFKMRRANSREKVESAKDEAETRIISRLEEERNFAREEAQRERAQRVADAKRIAKLEVENKFLKSYARRLMRALPAKEREIHETNFGPLDELPADTRPPETP